MPSVLCAYNYVMQVLNKMSMKTTLSLCVSCEFSRAVFVYYGRGPTFVLNRACLQEIRPLSADAGLFSSTCSTQWTSEKRGILFLTTTLANLNRFTARRNARIASAVLATTIPSVCPSVRLSVTRRIVSKRGHVARYSLHSQIAKCV